MKYFYYSIAPACPELFFLNRRTIGRQFTLGKKDRLKSRKLIEQVFKEGKSFSIFPYRVHYLLKQPNSPSQGQPQISHIHLPQKASSATQSPQLQAGFGASGRHFKKAVDRNRIKRLSREAYRLQKEPLSRLIATKGHPLAIFIIYTGKELPDYATAREKIGLALQKLIKQLG